MKGLASRSPRIPDVVDVRLLVYKVVRVFAMLLPEIPRIYTSFAEFEHDERQRLGLPPLPPTLPAPEPALPAPEPARAKPAPIKRSRPAPSATAALPAIPTPRPFVRVAVPPPIFPVSITHITPTILAALRAEGIQEVGSVPDTSILFVRTSKRFHVLHTTWLPERPLDNYAVGLAVAWIQDQGLSNYQAAKNLGVSEASLSKALLAAGYARLSPELLAQEAGTRTARKIGNRRGRLVRARQEARA